MNKEIETMYAQLKAGNESKFVAARLDRLV